MYDVPLLHTVGVLIICVFCKLEIYLCKMMGEIITWLFFFCLVFIVLQWIVSRSECNWGLWVLFHHASCRLLVVTGKWVGLVYIFNSKRWDEQSIPLRFSRDFFKTKIRSTQTKILGPPLHVEVGHTACNDQMFDKGRGKQKSYQEGKRVKNQGMRMHEKKEVWAVLSFPLAWKQSKENLSLWERGKIHL